MTNLPSHIQLIMPHKVRVISLQRIEDQSFIRLWDLCVREAPLVRQVHLSRHRPSVETRSFGVELQVDRLGGLEADDKLVAGNVLEDALGDVLELDADFDFGFVQG